MQVRKDHPVSRRISSKVFWNGKLTRFQDHAIRQEGKYLYEGKWLASKKIAALQKAAKKRDRIIFFEISALFLFTIATILGLLKGLTAFLLPM